VEEDHVNLSVRAFTGVLAGVLGVLATAMVWMTLSSTGSCRFEEPYETHSAHCDGLAGYALLWQPLLILVGVAGTAVLHGWLLEVWNQPRPWSAVTPGVCLVVLLAMAVWGWGLPALLLVPPTAFAVAGVITGFGRGSDGEAGSEPR
jgi:hypothetical protein